MADSGRRQQGDSATRYTTRKGARKGRRARALKTLRVRKFDVADYLRTDEDVAAYLEAVIAEGDGQLLAAALGDVARARGMSRLARNTGLTREALYRTLSSRGNPELATLNKVLRAMGLRLSVKAANRTAA